MMCAGVACICVNDAIAKTLTASYSPLQILFLRNVIALPFALFIALKMGGTEALRSFRPATHLLRAVVWICATILFFTSIKYLRLAEATALIFVAPMFVVAISAVFLGEHVGWRHWLAVVAGFVGVLIVIRPGSAMFQPVSLGGFARECLDGLALSDRCCRLLERSHRAICVDRAPGRRTLAFLRDCSVWDGRCDDDNPSLSSRSCCRGRAVRL